MVPVCITYDILSRLDKVGSSSVPTKGARASDQEALVAGLLAVENLLQKAQAVTEDGDKRRRDVRGTGVALARRTGRVLAVATGQV
jgi:hypothetical protein